MKETNIYEAVASSTRRSIIELLLKQPKSINEIAESFSSTRQAITKHIYVLENVGIVRIEKEGRTKICHVVLDPLHEVYSWVKKYEAFWDDKLSALEDHLKK